jgi:DNA polymerase
MDEVGTPPLIVVDWSLDDVRAAAARCRACPLWKRGTQTVFGEGARGGALFVGEQPGDAEDRAGRPFVGPAGKLLERALHEVGIARDRAWLTNVVKHFKWVPKGKRRIHERPNAREIAACRPWLDAEMRLVQPAVVVCLGATAAQALLGRSFRVTERRGEAIAAPDGRWFVATVHPSAVLRSPSDEARRRERAAFVRDLRTVAELLRAR